MMALDFALDLDPQPIHEGVKAKARRRQNYGKHVGESVDAVRAPSVHGESLLHLFVASFRSKDMAIPTAAATSGCGGTAATRINVFG
jgi:hypothetical protein